MNQLQKITPDPVEKHAVLPAPSDLVKTLFDDLEFEITVEGHKSSEGDGRTAADIEREMELAALES